MLRHWRKALECNFYPPQCLHSVWLGGFLSPKYLHYGENMNVSFNQDLLLRYPQVRCIPGRHVVGLAEIILESFKFDYDYDYECKYDYEIRHF